MFRRIAIVGCGLIGGSFAMALRRAGLAGEIVAFDRERATADRALAAGIVDVVAATIEDAVADADLVVVATPVGAARPVFAAIASSLAADAVVTDVGSTKRDVVAAARDALGAAIDRFVPGHPIAGGERHGPEAATAGLFDRRRVLLTPLPENDPASIARVTDAWTACGAIVETLDADVHDRVLSSVSHLPHLLAYALVAWIADAPDAALKFDLAGSGFRDFTRIAASSPEMWRDIALANRDALLADLDDFRADLDTMRASLAAGDGAALMTLFARASGARTAWQQDR